MNALTTPPRNPTAARPLPTGWLTLAEKSAACAEHGLDELRDFERAEVPIGRVPDRIATKASAWAARRSGPVPTTVTLFRVRQHLREPDLFAAVPTGGAHTGETR